MRRGRSDTVERRVREIGWWSARRWDRTSLHPGRQRAGCADVPVIIARIRCPPSNRTANRFRPQPHTLERVSPGSNFRARKASFSRPQDGRVGRPFLGSARHVRHHLPLRFRAIVAEFVRDRDESSSVHQGIPRHPQPRILGWGAEACQRQVCRWSYRRRPSSRRTSNSRARLGSRSLLPAPFPDDPPTRRQRDSKSQNRGGPEVRYLLHCMFHQ